MNEARKPLRIGILGAANIAPRAMVYPAQATGHIIAGVASRDLSRAESFARQYQVESAYGSYQELIDDPEIDLIYNALHNGGHAPWNMIAMEAGKHVISEKPAASNAGEASEVADVAKRTRAYYMEAFHYYYHPLTQRILDIIESGEIGEVTAVESRFFVPPPGPNDLRWNFDLAGGALMDIGCYSLHIQRMISQVVGEAEPEVLEATARTSIADSRVDAAMDISLRLANGATGLARFDMESEWDATLRIAGTAGVIVAPKFVVPSMDDRLFVTSFNGERVEHCGQLSSYTYQLLAFADAIDLAGIIDTDEDDAVAQAELMDASYLAAGLPLRPRFNIG